MIRILSLLGVLLCAAGASVQAQTLEAFRRHLSEPVSEGMASGRGRVTVTEHGDAARAVAEAAQGARRLAYKGHRVCIFFDNGPDARGGAMRARALFEQTFPGERVYMVYESPWFSVSVGNCLTAEEAIVLKGRIAGTFPKAFLKNETLSVSDLSE